MPPKAIKPVKTMWKSMLPNLKSSHGNIDWKIGGWQSGSKNPIRCASGGFHASDNIIDAFSYVTPSILAFVEVAGKSDKENDKEAWQHMRITKAYVWDKTASVKLAIFAAELVIGIYEKEYPKDDRPRKAIEAAKAYLANPTSAAAYTARAAAYAAYAAYDAAAYTARAAAYAAYAAYDAAAYAAYAAAYAAYAAAYAALEGVKQKCHEYVVNEIIPTLQEYAV